MKKKLKNKPNFKQFALDMTNLDLAIAKMNLETAADNLKMSAIIYSRRISELSELEAKHPRKKK